MIMMNKHRRYIIIMAALAAAVVMASTGTGHSAVGHESSHMNRIVNSEGCKACHSGRGIPGGGLLRGRSQNLCYKCHSFKSTSRGRAATDIESVMMKVSHHPVEETSDLHRRNEELPPRSSSAPRHVACSDCHLSHATLPSKAWNGLPGYRPTPVRGRNKGGPPAGFYARKAEFEYELCYRCHADGADKGIDFRDVSVELNPANQSYHPVEMAGRNKNVPSLVDGLSENSVIGCGSCHGNSDAGGAQGPHGSDFSPLLVAEYRTTDGPESSFSYSLCYICHERDSILADESFKSHNFHVALKSLSCGNCHNSHGSVSESHLIEFDSIGVTNAADGSGPLYQSGIPGMPKCLLNCHGVDHSTSGINGRPWPW
jgi:predicted CXXCH cytochrome family protein